MTSVAGAAAPGPPGTGLLSGRGPRRLGLALLVAAAVAGPFLAPGLQSQMAVLWVMVVLALTWDAVGGQMGYNSFGNIVFFGAGMYASAVVQRGLFFNVQEYAAIAGGAAARLDPMQYLGGLGLGLACAALVAVLISLPLGASILRLRGHYFAICTLGLGVAAGEIASAWDWLGAGSGLVTPLFPEELGNRNRFFCFYFLALAGACFVVLRVLYRCRFGLLINAIRDDEDKAEAMGLPTTRAKVVAWSVAAFFLALAGGAYGNFIGFIDPLDIAFSGATFGVWDDPDGDHGRARHAVGADIGRDGVPRRPGVVLDLPARLAPGRHGPADRRHRDLPAGWHPGLVPPAPRRHGAGGGAARMSFLLEVAGVSKSFGGVAANREISLSVPAGAVHGLIGPNGSGKTTLFNSIVGHHPVDAGSVAFDGTRIERLNVPRIARLGLLRTFQQTRVYGAMSCVENMQVSAPHRTAHGGVLLRRVPAAVTERAEGLLEFVGLAALRHHRAGSLSFGQQKLLEFAMALMFRPKMLLLDEPTAGINPTLINGMIDRLLRANVELGVTLLVIEHNMRVIMNLATHIYCLAHGRLLAAGTPEEVRGDPRVVEAYLGGG